jgi:hypothetical protein
LFTLFNATINPINNVNPGINIATAEASGINRIKNTETIVATANQPKLFKKVVGL